MACLDLFARLGIHEGAAAGGDDGRPSLQQALDHPALAIAERRLAVNLENIAHLAARCFLDLAV